MYFLNFLERVSLQEIWRAVRVYIILFYFYLYTYYCPAFNSFSCIYACDKIPLTLIWDLQTNSLIKNNCGIIIAFNELNAFRDCKFDNSYSLYPCFTAASSWIYTPRSWKCAGYPRELSGISSRANIWRPSRLNIEASVRAAFIDSLEQQRRGIICDRDYFKIRARTERDCAAPRARDSSQ